LQSKVAELVALLQQQAVMLEDVHRELDADNKLMESEMNDLSVKLDTMTSSLVSGVIANAKCILVS